MRSRFGFYRFPYIRPFIRSLGSLARSCRKLHIWNVLVRYLLLLTIYWCMYMYSNTQYSYVRLAADTINPDFFCCVFYTLFLFTFAFGQNNKQFSSVFRCLFSVTWWQMHNCTGPLNIFPLNQCARFHYNYSNNDNNEHFSFLGENFGIGCMQHA